MTDIAIRVENISKQYRIGGKQERYKTLRDTLVKNAKQPFQRILSVLRGQSATFSADTIWAIRGVSFEVPQGKILGIIGRNGSGKTTLLKILSRITEPSEGYAEVKGRIGSLLEVGTGFHPELTGRENIYLNGAILGMKKFEIERKFDEIISFAEIETFIDTPVKHYSSGMYMRLAFSVAAHLESDILLVDEVLAVGDAAFQKKCLGKMGDAVKEGRTVLFVSHNMGAIESLCNKCLLLSNGKITAVGKVRDVVASYYMESAEKDSRFIGRGCLKIDQAVLSEASKAGFYMKHLKAVTETGDDAPFARTGDPFNLEISFCTQRTFHNVAFVVRLYTRSGTELIRLSTNPISGYSIPKLRGEGFIRLRIYDLPLTADTYVLDVVFTHPFKNIIAEYKAVAFLTVSPNPVYQSGIMMDSSRGYFITPHEWELEVN